MKLSTKLYTKSIILIAAFALSSCASNGKSCSTGGCKTRAATQSCDTGCKTKKVKKSDCNGCKTKKQKAMKKDCQACKTKAA